MKIALVNLCKAEDFSKSESFAESISFLDEHKIDYVDFASGADTIESMVGQFHKALDGHADLLWVVRGGNTCIRTLDLLDWDTIAKSQKKFLGLSDFTHFSTIAVSHGATCYYGQGLNRIKQYFPTEADRKFIADFLKTGIPVVREAEPLAFSNSLLNPLNEKIIGGHVLLFTFMQSILKIDLESRYVFFEYHTGAVGEELDDLGYYIDQLLYAIKDNLPRGFILGRTELAKLDSSRFSINEINDYCVKKLSPYKLPIYYLDHFKNTIPFS